MRIWRTGQHSPMNNSKEYPPPPGCEAPRWSSLSDRRLYFSSIELEVVFELRTSVFWDYFEFALRVIRSNHSYKLQVKMVTCNCYRYSFFLRIVPEWNKLPCYAVEAGDLGRFNFRKLLLNHISICTFRNFILFLCEFLLPTLRQWLWPH